MSVPTLLVPGLNATPSVFQNQLDTLWKLGPLVIANTMRGIDMREIAVTILADAPRRFALLGFSLGGYVSFEILRQAPERVVGLALLDTSARPDTPEATERRLGAIALAEAGRFEQVVAQSFDRAVHPANRDSASLRELHRDMALRCGVDAYVRHQKAILARPDSRPVLSGFAAPAVVVVGKADEIAPPDVAREMADAMSGARLHVIEGAGHLALLERPGAVNAALRGWLEDVRAAGLA